MDMNPATGVRPSEAAVGAAALGALALAEERWAERRHASLVRHTPLIWLRAGRAAWAAGARPEAQTWYRRASDELLRLAERAGHPTGTFPYYAELALGAAALCGSPQLLEHVSGVVRHQTLPRQTRRWWNRARGHGTEPGLAAHYAVRAWAAWLAGAEQHAATLLADAAKQVRGFGPETATRWRAARWADVAAALEAMLSQDAEAAAGAMLALDAKLAAGWLTPPLLSDLVDETLAALAVQYRRRFERSLDRGAFHHVLGEEPE